MICKFKEICFNYPSECELCNATSDIVNNYPCFQNKDIVEVVRCKDCRFWKEYAFANGDERLLCEKEFGFPIKTTHSGRGECCCEDWKPKGHIIETGMNDYCSYGERKEE